MILQYPINIIPIWVKKCLISLSWIKMSFQDEAYCTLFQTCLIHVFSHTSPLPTKVGQANISVNI